MQGQVPSGFSGATTWSTQVAWAKSGIGKPTLGSEYEQVSNWVVARQQADLGVVRTVGGSVVVSSFSSGGAAGPVVTTLKFLDAKTGKPLAEKALPPGTFLGLSADTVAGKPVAVVRYLAAQDDKTPVVVVFDASGTQVWSSQGQQLATGLGLQGSAGLRHDENGEGLIVGGFMLRTNVGKDTSFNSDSSYDVLDTSGKSLLHVPFLADRIDENAVDIFQGYAVVWYDDSLSLSDPSQAKEHFAVYDLAAGGKKVGDLVENGSGGIALAAFHGKVLLSWAGKSDSGGKAGLMTVLDTATGQTTPPVEGPGDVGGGTLIDPATSNVLFYDNSDSPSSGSIMVSLTKGTVLWKQHDNHGPLVPLSMRDGVVYGIEAAQLGSSEGSQLAVKETDGSPVGTDYELSPMDFTADGAPLFAEVDSETGGDSSSDSSSGAGKVTMGVGHSG
ncbi:MAG: hypothetical protein ACJ786_27505 [Catenulispora sp.]